MNENILTKTIRIMKNIISKENGNIVPFHPSPKLDQWDIP
jgi:hypothetical protein